MDSPSTQLYLTVQLRFLILTALVLMLMNWRAVASYDGFGIDEMSFLNRYLDILGHYWESGPWPSICVICYASCLNAMLCLKQRLKSRKLEILSCCDIGLNILFFCYWGFIWFVLTFLLGFKHGVLNMSTPDFASNAIIIMTACLRYYIAGAYNATQLSVDYEYILRQIMATEIEETFV